MSKIPTPLTLSERIAVLSMKSDLECAQTELECAQIIRDSRLLHLKKLCLSLIHSRGLNPEQWCVNNEMTGFQLIPTPKEAKEVEPATETPESPQNAA